MIKPLDELRNDPDWDFQAGIIAHTFPMAALAVAGDPMNLHVERFHELLSAAVDVVNWKAGGKEEDRLDNLLMRRLEGVVKE